MTTGDPGADLEVQARQARIVCYLHKPAGYRDLEPVLSKAVRGVER